MFFFSYPSSYFSPSSSSLLHFDSQPTAHSALDLPVSLCLEAPPCGAANGATPPGLPRRGLVPVVCRSTRPRKVGMRGGRQHEDGEKLEHHCRSHDKDWLVFSDALDAHKYFQRPQRRLVEFPGVFVPVLGAEALSNYHPTS